MSLANGASPTVSTYPSHGNQLSPPADAQATAVAALSQQHGTPHAISTANGRKRRASGAPGSRGVANLTPEQLAKKRANDREAQRAIRERTRNTIESLEGRIKELESQQPFQELQRVVQERDRAIGECIELRQKLNNIAQAVGVPAAQMNGGGGQHSGHAQQGSLSGTFALDDLIDPVWLTMDSDAELAALTAQQSPLPPLGHQQQQLQPYPPASGSSNDAHLHPGLRSPAYPSAALTSPPNFTAAVGPQFASPGTQRRWSPSLEALPHPQAQQLSTLQNGTLQEQHSSPQANMQPQQNGDRLGLNFVLDTTPKAQTESPADQTAFTSPQTHRQVRSPPLYARLPLNSAPTCPLDVILEDFVAESRRQVASGKPIRQVLGPEYPSFIAMLAPDSPQRDHCHPLSVLLIDILFKFEGISAMAERVAIIYTVFLVMRWLICPCERCYERLPEFFRPGIEQLEIPHAQFVETLPWYVESEDASSCSLFDELVHEDFVVDTTALQTLECGPELLTHILRPFVRKQLATTGVKSTDEFLEVGTTTLSVNWPHSEDLILLPPRMEEHDEATITRAFEAHLWRAENWTVGERFASTFPELIGGEVRITKKA